MSDDLTKLTKAELIEQLVSARQDLTHERKVAQNRDAEAKALDKCVKALDSLPKVKSSGYRSDERVNTSAIGRVLSYLRERYGLPDPYAEVDRLREELDRVTTERDDLRMDLDMVRTQVGS